VSIAWARTAGFPKAPERKQPLPPWELPPWDRVAFFATERCVYYTLVKTLGFVREVDFRFQVRIPVKGINQTGMARSDFWVLPTGQGARYGVGAWPYYYGRILNPIASTLLIHTPAKDRFERDLIRKQHFDIIYILDSMLFAQPKTMVELALRGTDKSGR
jgi:hypothetical protein